METLLNSVPHERAELFSFNNVRYGSGAFNLQVSIADIGIRSFLSTTNDGELMTSREVSVTVKSRLEKPDKKIPSENLILISLQVNPPLITLSPAQVAQITVTGLFSNGSTADLTLSDLGTTSQIGSTAIAFINTKGQVTGLQIGSTDLMVLNSSVTTRALIRVQNPATCTPWPFGAPIPFSEPMAGPFNHVVASSGEYSLKERFTDAAIAAWGDFNKDEFSDSLIVRDIPPGADRGYVDLFIGNGATWNFHGHLY